MTRHVVLPPETGLRLDGALPGGWWHDSEEPGRIVCDLCPRECSLKPGDRGFCFVRANQDGQMVLTTYGRSTGFCIDPIEKKPLNHFYPGSSVLSFGTAGCNLGCKFCQNWDISKSREIERLSEQATPETIAEAACQLGCRSVAYTYNDPVIWAEYAIDAAKACRAVGVKSVAVTAGYIRPEARPAFFEYMDAANVDLKAFTEDFYHKITYSHLQPVLDTLEWLKKESSVWFEITNLVIPQANDSLDEIRLMCDWILDRLGDEVPLHFTAFHPDFRMTDRPPTPHETLLKAQAVARKQGLRFVYVGNVNDVEHQSTFCPGCGGLLIERNWYELGRYHMDRNRCQHCGEQIAGRFDTRPGDWGRKRLPVRIASYARAESGVTTSPRPIHTERESTMTTASDTGIQSREVTNRPQLTDEGRRAVHLAASRMIVAAVHGRTTIGTDPTMGGTAATTVMGVFTTLKRRGHLRGCCGSLGRPLPLQEALHAAATRTALHDLRLPAVSPSELPHLDLDVTLLFNFQPVRQRGASRLEAVTIGRHGLQVRRGELSGLLLPIVAEERAWSPKTFLDQVCRKAGLPAIAWQDDETELVTFEGLSIPGPLDPSAIGPGEDRARLPFSGEDVTRLAEHCRTNLIALARGATPSYYLPGGADGTVTGAAIQLRFTDSAHHPIFSKFSLRPGVPLQATLYHLTEAAAGMLRGQMSSSQLGQLNLALTILLDPALHGTVSEPDLAGIDPQTRAVLVLEGSRSAWILDPQREPAELVAAAAEDASVASPSGASVFSLAALSTEKSISVSGVPRAQAERGVRPPAVAGTFYPADESSLYQLVDELLAPAIAPKTRWPAIMVPHAGLVYSGRVAAAVLGQTEIPETVLILGPKHTRLGVEWAIAPHDTWQLPGAALASDPELARRLAAAIPGLQLDSAAHAREHAIEVELPFLARLAPQARVLGIVIGAGNLERCERFAAGLADVLSSLEKPPLLIISSDMHHFATDGENRRLDEIALAALERLDPADVYETVVGHGISMCGVLPAVIVLDTLRRLGQLTKCQRVAYATTAEVTGDTSRVVGYAGMLFG